jgi:hypothetical protein
MIRSLARSIFVLFTAAAACGGSSNGSGSTGTGTDAGMDAGAPPGDGGGGGPYATEAISLSQTDVHIPRFTMTAFAVTGHRADGSSVDLTEQAVVQSSNPKVATVDHGPGAQIQIHAQDQEGTATILVTVGNLRQTCAVTVFSN